MAITVKRVEIYVAGENVGAFSGDVLRSLALLMQGSISKSARDRVYEVLDADAASDNPVWNGAKIFSALLNLRWMFNGGPDDFHDEGVTCDFHWVDDGVEGNRELSLELMRAIIADDVKEFYTHASAINLPVESVGPVMAAAKALLDQTIPVIAMPPIVENPSAASAGAAAQATEVAIEAGQPVAIVDEEVISAAAADPNIAQDTVAAMQEASKPAEDVDLTLLN